MTVQRLEVFEQITVMKFAKTTGFFNQTEREIVRFEGKRSLNQIRFRNTTKKLIN